MKLVAGAVLILLTAGLSGSDTGAESDTKHLLCVSAGCSNQSMTMQGDKHVSIAGRSSAGCSIPFGALSKEIAGTSQWAKN